MLYNINSFSQDYAIKSGIELNLLTMVPEHLCVYMLDFTNCQCYQQICVYILNFSFSLLSCHNIVITVYIDIKNHVNNDSTFIYIIYTVQNEV